MQKAYLITENTDLSQDFGSYDRLYFGDAYCEHNLFSFLEDEEFLVSLQKLGKPLTIVTPIISDTGMKKLEKFLTSPPTPLLKGEGSIDEVVINDYGVLHMVHEQFPTLQIIWGNFLSGQNKDPYLKDFVDKSEHRHLSIDSAYYSNLFKEYGVQNIELYNVFQGMEIGENFGIHLYYPYVVYSINRYCITNLIYEKKDYLTVVESCSGCKGKVQQDLDMQLKIGGEMIKNYFRGNKQFYKNEEKKMIAEIRPERIIYNYDLLCCFH